MGRRLKSLPSLKRIVVRLGDKKMSKLTPKQKKFVDEYLIDLNGTQAAIRAGYSEKTAKEQAARLLSNVNITARLTKRINSRAERTEVTQDAVIKELAAIAFSTGADYAEVLTTMVGQKVVIKDTSTLSETQRKAIAGIKQGKHGIEISSCDKVKALELLGRHLGMFTDKVDLNGKIENGGMVEIVLNVPRPHKEEKCE